MSARIARTIALGVGAGALVLAAAGPAFAADPISTFPAKVALYTAPVAPQVNSVVVAPTIPAGAACATAGETTAGFLAPRAVGKKGTVTITAGPAACQWTVTAAKKGNAVVKFVWDSNGSTVDEGRTVQSVVVKVNPQSTGKPAKPSKP